jgi:hypothetical protein
LTKVSRDYVIEILKDYRQNSSYKEKFDATNNSSLDTIKAQELGGNKQLEYLKIEPEFLKDHKQYNKDRSQDHILYIYF